MLHGPFIDIRKRKKIKKKTKKKKKKKDKKEQEQKNEDIEEGEGWKIGRRRESHVKSSQCSSTIDLLLPQSEKNTIKYGL